MSWDTAKKRADEPSGAGIFVRLADDNDKVTGAFIGEPHVRELIWDTKLDRYRDYTPADKAASEKSTPKFALNFFVPAEKGVKIIEMNQKTFQDVCTLKDKYGLDKFFFEVTRHGKKGDTKTTYQILPDAQMTEADLATIKGSKLHDLVKASNANDANTDLNSHDAKAAAPNGATNGTNGAHAAAPAQSPAADEFIGTETALAMVTRLKAMPKAKLDEFLARFGIKTIKTIKKSDTDAALAFLDSLEGKAPAAQVEQDPFA
jgi:hypothetical protein